MQNIDIVQLNYIATLNGELTVCMPPCLTYTKNRSFGVKGFSLVTNSIPVFIPKLYTRSLTAIYTEINTASDYIYNFNDNNNTCVMIDNTLNPAFNYNGQTYNTTTYPILQVQRNLYSNTNETIKYFHCFNFIYFLSMIESQMQTVNNGILFNYNMNDNTISISV